MSGRQAGRKSRNSRKVSGRGIQCFPRPLPVCRNIERVACRIENIDSRHAKHTAWSGGPNPRAKGNSFYRGSTVRSDSVSLTFVSVYYEVYDRTICILTTPINAPDSTPPAWGRNQTAGVILPLCFLPSIRVSPGPLKGCWCAMAILSSSQESMSGLHLHDGNPPSLALIDRRLDILEQLRNQARLRTIPFIAILPVEHQFSEEDHIDDLEKGFDLVFCSDRYRELIAQIRAMFRRKKSEHHRQFGAQGRLSRDGFGSI